MKGKTKALSLGAMLCAAETVLLLLSGVLPSGRLALTALAGAVNAAVMLEAGPVWAWSVWIITALLGLLLCPLKGPVLLYLLFFGCYPILKSYLERLPGGGLPWLCKYAVFLVSGTVLLLLYRAALLSGICFPQWGYVLLIAAGFVLFAVYDVLLSGLIEYYRNRKNKQ